MDSIVGLLAAKTANPRQQGLKRCHSAFTCSLKRAKTANPRQQGLKREPFGAMPSKR